MIFFKETLPRFIHAKTLSESLMWNKPQKRDKREAHKSSVICRHIGTLYFSFSSSCSLILDVYIILPFKIQQFAGSRDEKARTLNYQIFTYKGKAVTEVQMTSLISYGISRPCPADLGNGLPRLHLACLGTKAKSGQQLLTRIVGEVGDGCTDAGIPRPSWELITLCQLG